MIEYKDVPESLKLLKAIEEKILQVSIYNIRQNVKGEGMNKDFNRKKDFYIAAIVRLVKNGSDTFQFRPDDLPTTPENVAKFSDFMKTVITEIEDRYSVGFGAITIEGIECRFKLRKVLAGSPIKLRDLKPWHALSIGQIVNVSKEDHSAAVLRLNVSDYAAKVSHKLSVADQGEHFTITRTA